MATINQFISNVKAEGMARNNYFEVLMTLPSGMVNNAQDLQKILLYCESTQLPALNVSTNEIRIFGEPRAVPYEKLYDNITMVFYVDMSMSVKYFFDRWFNLIQDKDSRTSGYYADYTIPEIRILVVDKGNLSRYFVKLHECYPKTMGAITLDQSNKEIMRVEVSFNYKYWESEVLAVGTDRAAAHEIPDKYFKNFDAFQSDVNNIVGGITRDLTASVTEEVNALKLGDNFNSDFIGVV